jgi:glycine betaine/proline transport system substrate-binding protein
MKIRKLFGKWVLLAAVVAVAAMMSTASFAAKGIIKLHEGDWTGNLVSCKLLQIILEDEMDYKVKMIFLPAGPVVSEAIIGGELDAACESWPSYSTSKEKYVTEFGGDGSIEYFGAMGVVGVSGWYVPRYVIEGDAARGIEAVAPDLRTFEQLNQYGEVFKTPETAPRGRLLACPVEAWQCMDAERAIGLGVDYEPVVLGSEIAHWAELDAAYSRGDPLLFYAWEPHWVHAKYDLVEIGLPDYSEDKWPATDWPEDVTYNYGSTELKEKYPDVHQLINNQNLSNEQQAGMILDVDINGMELDAAVRKWMAANEDVWRAWIPAPM